jgi:bifunctional UDP-N-acetylglucosamine pyrophosphorylase/glucosamine-1-phosphate N-acetyltransferase
MQHFLAEPKSFTHSSAQISKQASIRGDNIYIGKNVKIMEHATIVGPAYLGDNTVVANNALVRNSFIGSNCVVGYGTEVARSYLHSAVWTHSNYIGDSVIDTNVSFGAGSITGNLRLDDQTIKMLVGQEPTPTQENKLGCVIGRGARLGINVSLMPGIKVGPNAFVGAGVVVQNDIPANSFVVIKQSIKIDKNKQKFTIDSRQGVRKKMMI